MKLSDIESLELVDRRGYLTITISQLREGKIFLRTTQGLQDWYNVIQVSQEYHLTAEAGQDIPQDHTGPSRLVQCISGESGVSLAKSTIPR